jgi:hypothetical protein
LVESVSSNASSDPSAANVWTTSLSSVSVICGTFYRATLNITMRREHIFPLTRIVPSDAPCNRPLQDGLSLFPKLVGCTIATNVAPLEA